MREIVITCPRAPIGSVEPVRRSRTPSSGRLLGEIDVANNSNFARSIEELYERGAFHRA